MRLPMTEALEAIADSFHPREQITAIRSLGSGNVNETFLVTHKGFSNTESFVMQRLNTAVFERPDLVMRNLQVLGAHMDRRMATPPPELQGRHWELPRIVPCRNEDSAWVEHNGEFWRSITYISAATTSNEIQDCNQANELGYGLGMFHNLIHDLAIHQLADTLENFHVTPEYLNRFDTVLKSCSVLDPSEQAACAFIDKRREGVDVLEAALARGELQHRPIHGDPKINNVMIDETSGKAIGLIDLDTVKPGLIHYDIGDCIRSCCNAAGEETTDLESVGFDLNLCEAMLEGYINVARGFLSEWDLHYLPDCIRLIPLELGLRFLTDHLEGNVYFKTDRPSHNLQRAAVQFKLVQDIENQMPALQRLIQRLSDRPVN